MRVERQFELHYLGTARTAEAVVGAAAGRRRIPVRLMVRTDASRGTRGAGHFGSAETERGEICCQPEDEEQDARATETTDSHLG